jgi:hypothetical protein
VSREELRTIAIQMEGQLNMEVDRVVVILEQIKLLQLVAVFFNRQFQDL